MMRKISALSFLLTFFLSSWSFAGTKEEIIRLQSDVLQLQEQIRFMQKGLDERSGTAQSLLEQLNDQVAKTNLALQQMVELMRGQKSDMNQLTENLRQEIQGLGVKLEDTNSRVAGLHQKFDEVQAQRSSRPIPSASDPNVKPDQVYNYAFNDYLAGNYELAISGLQDFLVNYPDSEYADNAAFYLGVSLQNVGRLEQAAQAFDEVINLYPKGDMTPSAYYKKALVEQELQRNERAIETFTKLVTLFPESQEAIIARQELENLGVDTGRKNKKRN